MWKYVFLFYLYGLSILKPNERGIFVQCTNIIKQSTIYSCRVLIKLEFYRQIFEKYRNVWFHENSSSRSRDVQFGRQADWRTGGETDRQRDRHDEANSRLLQFCERAQLKRMPKRDAKDRKAVTRLVQFPSPWLCALVNACSPGQWPAMPAMPACQPARCMPPEASIKQAPPFHFGLSTL